jgi:hypothetical protein
VTPNQIARRDTIARMTAAGCSRAEIAQAVGLKPRSITVMRGDTSMKALIARAFASASVRWVS